ncbi:MAG: hypothetical protein ABII93_07695 [Chrysiogenia bacterium]
MGAKNFVNQFKNTRRLAGLQGRRPLGGQARVQMSKSEKSSGRAKKNSPSAQRSFNKYSGAKGK